MEFHYKMTARECFGLGLRKTFRRLFIKSKALPTVMLAVGGAVALIGAANLAGLGGGGLLWLLALAYILAALLFTALVFCAPVEIASVYRQYGKNPVGVRFCDGSLFVSGGGSVREYLCRNILEFRRRGGMYRIAVTGRMGVMAELYLPVRLVGDKQEQDAFWRYVNDQRKISGDKLAKGNPGTETVPDADTGGAQFPGRLLQKWNLDTLAKAGANTQWIMHHCMARRKWKDWAARNTVAIGGCILLGLVSLQFAEVGGMTGIAAAILFLALLAFREMQQGERISLCRYRDALGQYGPELYEESWALSFSPQGVVRECPMLKTEWDWQDVGYLLESDDFFYFFTKGQQLMFYMEKDLLGDWMARKFFIQGCQSKGVQFQEVHPDIERDMPEHGRGTGAGRDAGQAGSGREVAGHKGFRVIDGGISPGKKGKGRERGIPDTQEGWRKFWAAKEKEKGRKDRIQVIITVLALVGIFLLAVFLPEFDGGQDLGGYPVMMDMPKEGEPYVFHPDLYEDYVPLAEQAEVLKSLGFEIPQEILDGMYHGMEEMPEQRAWVEGYPYASLLCAIGMPGYDTENWEIIKYPDQAYWFDWEGFDLDMEYVHILNGVNVMAGGDFSITDIRQDMSGADWEKGSGTIRLSFRIDGALYEYPLVFMNDWLDTDIIGDINDALEKSGIGKRVYAAGDGGQGCILMYRDKEWAKEFKKKTGIRLEER